MKEHTIPMSPDPNPIKILTDESTIALWNKQKLPSDSVSIENGTILTNSARYPLMIDPQLQGITWIREKEKANNLKTLRLGSKNINRDLELSIENGYSAIIENMNERIEIEVKEKQVEAEAKKKEADAFAEVVGREKDKVEKENNKATIEADKCALIKVNVEAQKTSTQQDLDAAQPLVE